MHRLPSLLMVACLASCAQTVDVEHEEAALLAAATEWGKTGGAIDQFTSFLAPDARLSYWGSPALEGPRAIREAIGPLMKTAGFSMTWQPTRATVAASGDLGYTIGSFTMTFQNANGMLITEHGKQQTTWRKLNDTWKVIEDTGTSNAQLPVLSQPALVPATAVKWLEPPSFLAPGATFAVVAGNPAVPEPFTVRLRLPQDYRLAPHTHPTDHHVTVLSGSVAVGIGNARTGDSLTDVEAGGFIVKSTTMTYQLLARTAATIQVSGIGPFTIDYVDPADRPSPR